MFARLLPPSEVYNKSQRDIELVQEMYRARRVSLGKRKTEDLETKIRKRYEEWESQSAGKRSRLAELNDFLEGKPEPTDFPFGSEDSSNIDIRLAVGYMRIFRAHAIRAIFGDSERTYVVLPAPGTDKKQRNKVERGINWAAENETNLNSVLKDSFVPAFRDGTGLIHGCWERKLEHGVDFKTYSDAEEFLFDYPDSESAGIAEEEFDRILGYMAEPEAELTIEYEIDFISKNGPTFTLFPRAKFISWPMYEQEMSNLSMYGYAKREGHEEFEGKAQNGFYIKSAIEQVRKRKNVERNHAMDIWDRRRESLEGVNTTNSSAISYNLAHLVISEDLDGDGIFERYSVVYDLDTFRILRIETYGIRRNIPNIVPLRLIRKDGRFDGDSLLGDAEPLFREINALHRHRSNQRRLTDSVVLMLPDSLKDEFDLGAEYAEFKPGRTLWLPDQYMDQRMAPRQLQIFDTSRTGTSQDEEALLIGYVELMLGLSQGQGGRESAVDPTAPASKTRMLLARADMRIEDLLDEWRRTIPDILYLLLALYYQNAGKTMKIMKREGEDFEDEEIETSFFGNPNLRAALKAIKPTNAPEEEMNKIAALVVAAMKFVLPVQAKPDIIVHLWNDFVIASRIDRPERLMIQIQDDGSMMMGGQEVSPDQLRDAVGQMSLANQEEKAPEPGTRPRKSKQPA